MKFSKRIISIFFAVILCFVFPTTVMAADVYGWDIGNPSDPSTWNKDHKIMSLYEYQHFYGTDNNLSKFAVGYSSPMIARVGIDKLFGKDGIIPSKNWYENNLVDEYFNSLPSNYGKYCYLFATIKTSDDIFYEFYWTETPNVISSESSRPDVSLEFIPSDVHFSFWYEVNYLGRFGSANFHDTVLNDYSDEIYYDGSGDKLTVVFPGSVFLDENGNKIDLGGDIADNPNAPQNKYRLQAVLERYTSYKEENYKGATALSKFNDWYSRPHVAYDDDNVTKLGTNGSYMGFYFKPITNGSPLSEFVNYLGSTYYTYHLYYWTGSEWAKRSLWTSVPLEFTPAKQINTLYKPPSLLFQPNTFAIQVDYAADGSCTMKSILQPETGSSAFEDGNHFYLVNDDIAVAKDKNNGSMGTIVVDSNGNLTDDSGGSLDGETNWDGAVTSPPKPGADGSIVDWFKWFFDSVEAVFKTITTGFGNIVSSCSGFFSFLSGSLSFLPAEFWAIVLAGIAVIVVLRILGR